MARVPAVHRNGQADKRSRGKASFALQGDAGDEELVRRAGRTAQPPASGYPYVHRRPRGRVQADADHHGRVAHTYEGRPDRRQSGRCENHEYDYRRYR